MIKDRPYKLRRSLAGYVILLGILSFGLTLESHAKNFANEYTQFELPPGWECALEGSEWVCQSTNEERKKEAIIILVAKIRGEQDSLEEYLGYLKKAKTYNLPGGKVQVSEAKYAKYETVNEQRWVDALHLASEVPGFYTRYMATVKEDLGIAVTFSVSKEHYTLYQSVFDKVIASMRVFRQKKVNLAEFKLKSKDENLLDNSVFVPDENQGFNIAAQKKQRGVASKGGGDTMLYGILGAVAVVGFIMMKKKKK